MKTNRNTSRRAQIFPKTFVFCLFLLFGVFYLIPAPASAQACVGTCVPSQFGCGPTMVTGPGTCPDPTTQECCWGGVAPTPDPDPGPTPDPAPAAAANDTTTVVTSPLALTTVEELLNKVLGFAQSFMVILSLIFIVIGAIFYITSGGDSGRIETAKKAITAALIGLAIGIAAPSFLKEIYTILGTTPSGVPAAKSLLEIAGGVLNFLLSIVGVIALIMLIVGALMYLTAAGSEDRIDTGKKIVKYSIIGIIIALAAMVLVRQVAGFF